MFSLDKGKSLRPDSFHHSKPAAERTKFSPVGYAAVRLLERANIS